MLMRTQMLELVDNDFQEARGYKRKIVQNFKTIENINTKSQVVIPPWKISEIKISIIGGM